MIVEDSIHVVFDETNAVQQDQRPNIVDEDMLQKKNLL